MILTKKEILERYKRDVDILRKNAREKGLQDSQINKIFEKCLREIEEEYKCSKPKSKVLKCINCFLLISAIVLCCVLFLCVLLNVDLTISSLVLRNVQGLTYPALKLVRLLSLPVIRRFPSLTRLYDETCLIENPFFHVQGMECWPCEDVHAVIDMTGSNNHTLYGSGIPYIVKTAQNQITFEDLKTAYLQNQQLLDTDADIVTSNADINSLKKLFEFTPKSSRTHIKWRINRMKPTHVIRDLFPRPNILDEWSGQSVERYVMIDEPNAPAYTLPNMECSYIFLIQGSGERSIVLKPSKECMNHCKTVSVNLKHPYLLWYNWWYWRPISLPVENSKETSITYINSHC